ncbi:MAG: LysM peptidoglycan-binding domain-containing protein [Chloroflexi bacterium]|nr:LysM peptidoglycan-binding domain-containing protein [Chloroflexota bacterium]
MRRRIFLVVSILLLAISSSLYAQDDGGEKPAGSSGSEMPAAYDTYIIQGGDTLDVIARRFNTTVEDLKAANAIFGNQIIAGQVLLIPRGEARPVAAYEIQPGDTLFSISKRFDTSIGILQGMNELGDSSAIVAGQTILVPALAESSQEVERVEADDSASLVPSPDDSMTTVHVVQRGDTLYDLSRLYNTTVDRLRRLNNLGGGSSITIGSSLVVPKIDETILERYIVQAGDSLYSIAQRYDVEWPVLQALNRMADARDIREGQAILVPILEGVSLVLHVIKRGDTLEELAEQYETSVARIQALNGIADPSLIVLGKAILVPAATEIQVRAGFGFGIQAFIDGARASELAARATKLGVDWVKIDVPWAEIETAPMVYSYAALDSMVATMELAGLKILLNVYDAPAWSRKTYTETLNSQFLEYAGPPENYDDFASFLANLVIRYAGLVDAYEIWKSPNLLKFWTVPVYTRAQEMTADGDYGIPDQIQIGARYYVPLLKIAYETIKAHDEAALVVAAGLAPVGFNDGYNSIDTGTFLKNMLLEGAADVSDAIGAIFSASAAPPSLRCCDKPPGVDTHYESFLQYFVDLLAFYDETLMEQGVELPVIVTQLGWGTTDGANLAVPSTGFEWLHYTNEDEQALYVAQAYRIAQRLENVAAMFLYNLNGCAVGDEEACFFSLEDADGQMRPVFSAYQSVPKTREAA